MGDRAGAERPVGERCYHPWDDAGRRFADWRIRRCNLNGLYEVMCVRRKVILLEANRTKVERRCDLAHALAHIDLGHQEFTDHNEEAAVRYAAKKLLHRDEVVQALRLTEGQMTHETAELLAVDMPTLRARLTHLHPVERIYIRERLQPVLDGITP
jgi:Zn-dependent peptidase ImmA (M78 family)